MARKEKIHRTKVRLQYVGVTIGCFKHGMKRTFGISDDFSFPCAMSMKPTGKPREDLQYMTEEEWDRDWKVIA